MDTQNTITVIGAASGIGAGRIGCEQAPELLVTSPILHACHLPLRFAAIHKQSVVATGLAAMPAIAAFDRDLAKDVFDAVSKQQPLLVLGGDQSVSVGTWSGVACAVQARNETLGLIWIDAHMDAHTVKTTESGNIHGMPLAALLGYGEAALTTCLQPQTKLQPNAVCLIGTRSYEKGEADLLKQLGVRIYFMEEVQQRGIETILLEARQHILQSADCFGIALDMDSIDPSDAPGVGTPVDPGIPLKELIKAVKHCVQVPLFIAAEIVEFNPTLDVANQTETAVTQMIEAFFGAHHEIK